MFNFVLAAHAMKPVPSCIGLFQSHGQHRWRCEGSRAAWIARDLSLKTNKQTYPGLRPGEGITIRAQKHGLLRPTDAVCVCARMYISIC